MHTAVIVLLITLCLATAGLIASFTILVKRADDRLIGWAVSAALTVVGAAVAIRAHLYAATLTAMIIAGLAVASIALAGYIKLRAAAENSLPASNQ